MVYRDFRFLIEKKLVEMEPNIADNAVAAFYAPTAGIVCPFDLNIAMAENACENGVEFKFDTEVTDLKKDGGINSHKSGRFQDKICGECSRCLCRQIPQYGK